MNQGVIKWDLFFGGGSNLMLNFFIDDLARDFFGFSKTVRELWVCKCYTMTPLSSGSRYSMDFFRFL